VKYSHLSCLAVVVFLSAGAACSADRAPATVATVAPVTLVASKTNPFRIGRPLVIPHAGGDATYPENTIYAYEHSLATGGDVVDADVWMSADGVPVAIHDSTLERTTNGSGRVAETTAADMGALDAGWGFERDGAYPFRNLGITIPTIEQVLTTFPTRLITLDLKDQRVELVAPVCELLIRLRRTQDVYVGVDTSEQVLQFRKICPEVHTSGTDEERAIARAARDAGDKTFVSHQLVGQPGFLGNDGKKRITAEFLEFSHMNDIAVMTWVVDDPKDISDLIDMGIDGIYTRRPDVMIKLLQEKGLLPAA
jgi:glycerophosphoryl diester phosphodiesterase